jgi:hypothetical protein
MLEFIKWVALVYLLIGFFLGCLTVLAICGRTKIKLIHNDHPKELPLGVLLILAFLTMSLFWLPMIFKFEIQRGE